MNHGPSFPYHPHHHAMPLRWMACLLLLAMMPAVGGCQNGEDTWFKGDASRQSHAAGDWPFTPVLMQFHSFTRVVDEAEQTIIDARLEFRDAFADVSKAVGRVRFEFYANQRNTQQIDPATPASQTWFIDISEAKMSQRHYDPVTRTYQFRLRVRPVELLDVPGVLLVYFDDPTGLRLNDEMIIDPEA